MKLEQLFFNENIGWNVEKREDSFDSLKAQIVLVFGFRELVEHPNIYEYLANQYPNADIVLVSTAGEIISKRVEDKSVVSTAVQFNKTNIRCISKSITKSKGSANAGEQIALDLKKDDLRHILLLSDGQIVNGTELVKGVNRTVAENVIVSGGLAGDEAHFRKTAVGLNGIAEKGNIVGIGFYGDDIKIGTGTNSGWDEFGPYRKVTRSVGNKLYELDNKSALELYKKYLGDKANDLPGSALLFPLSMKLGENSKPLVRTILGIDEKKGAMIFAGDIIEGSVVRMMKANFDRLIEGAYNAANESINVEEISESKLVLLISCVGRKLVLNQRIEEEIEAVVDVFGELSTYVGFYSYGEISPYKDNVTCDLHNQTMTITTYSE